MRTLRDRAVHVLVNRLLEEEDFDPNILGDPGRIADFWELVREYLQTRSIESGNTLSFARVLASAYPGSSHLDLVRFSILPPEGLFLALRTEELAGVKSISLCVDRISGSVDHFVSELSKVDINVRYWNLSLVFHPCQVTLLSLKNVAMPIGSSPESTISNPPNRSIISGPYIIVTHFQYGCIPCQLLEIPPC